MSGGLSVRRRPHDPGVPIDYVLLSPDAGPGAVDAADAGHDAGFEAGYAEGLQTARVQAAEEARQARARLDRACDALAQASDAAERAFAERHAALEQSVAAFAFELVEALVGRELELATHPGRDAVARALAADRGTLPATARIHPADAETFSGTDAGLLAGSRTLTFVVDESVEPGGALVDIGGATIDAQLSTALERVREVLIGEAADSATGTGTEGKLS